MAGDYVFFELVKMRRGRDKCTTQRPRDLMLHTCSHSVASRSLQLLHCMKHRDCQDELRHSDEETIDSMSHDGSQASSAYALARGEPIVWKVSLSVTMHLLDFSPGREGGGRVSSLQRASCIASDRRSQKTNIHLHQGRVRTKKICRASFPRPVACVCLAQLSSGTDTTRDRSTHWPSWSEAEYTAAIACPLSPRCTMRV